MMEYIPRNISGDPIKKYFQIVVKENHYALAVRQSGCLDIYYNFVRINSPLIEQGKPLSLIALADVEDIDGTFAKMLIKPKNKEGILQLSLSLKDRMFYRSVKQQNAIPTLDLALQHRIKKHGNKIRFNILIVNIYNSWYVEQSGVHIAHGPFLSSFEWSKSQWVNHI